MALRQTVISSNRAPTPLNKQKQLSSTICVRYVTMPGLAGTQLNWRKQIWNLPYFFFFFSFFSTLIMAIFICFYWFSSYPFFRLLLFEFDSQQKSKKNRGGRFSPHPARRISIFKLVKITTSWKLQRAELTVCSFKSNIIAENQNLENNKYIFQGRRQKRVSRYITKPGKEALIPIIVLGSYFNGKF